MSRDFILGPQVPLDDSWFTRTQLVKGKALGEALPAIPPPKPSSPVEPIRKDFGSDADYQSALNNWLTTPVIKEWLDALNDYLVNRYYYDLGKSLYIAHKRSGDPAFLTLARKCVDSWWQYPAIDQGRKRLFPNEVGIAPRNAAIGGLALRAIDGRPELWDWIVAYVQAQKDIWLKWRINNTSLHVGVREGAFALHYAVWLSQTLPDSYPLQAGGTATNGAQIRAQLLADAELIATNYYGRLQFPDGSWRWDDVDVKDADGGTLKGITQAFQIGLLLLALADLHQITTKAEVKENVKNQILKGCRHLYEGGPYRKDDPTPYDPTKKWRCFWYLYHGGTTVNPTKFEKGGWSLPGKNIYEVSDARQSIGPVVAAYGYAYKISGDPFFKTAGDELWDAAYNGTDGIRNLFDTDGKGYNQNARRAGSYLAWAGQPATLPSPIPPQPPTGPATPSPDGAEGPTVTDSTGAVWTLGPLPDSRTLRNGVDVGGAGKRYLYWQKTVYLQGMSDGWFKWTGTDWKFNSADRPPVPVVQPAPTPTPVPVPTPTPVKDEYVSKGFRKLDVERTALYQEMWKQGYGAWEELEGNNIKFRLFPK